MRARNTYGFSVVELLILLCLLLVVSSFFIGYILPFPYSKVVPYGSLPMLGAILLTSYWTEAAGLQLAGREAGVWRAFGVNLACTLLGFLFAVILYVVARWSLGAARTFALTLEIVLLQMAVILLVPPGLRYLWERYRQRRGTRFNFKVLMLLPQFVPPLIILLPIVVMGSGSLLYKASFHPDTARASSCSGTSAPGSPRSTTSTRP